MVNKFTMERNITGLATLSEIKLERHQSRSEFVSEDGGEGGIEFFFASDARSASLVVATRVWVEAPGVRVMSAGVGIDY